MLEYFFGKKKRIKKKCQSSFILHDQTQIGPYLLLQCRSETVRDHAVQAVEAVQLSENE